MSAVVDLVGSGLLRSRALNEENKTQSNPNDGNWRNGSSNTVAPVHLFEIFCFWCVISDYNRSMKQRLFDRKKSQSNRILRGGQVVLKPWLFFYWVLPSFLRLRLPKNVQRRSNFLCR